MPGKSAKALRSTSGRVQRIRARALPWVVLPLTILAGVANLSSTGEQQTWFVSRIEFNLVDYVESPHGLKFRGEFAPAVFMEKLSATEYFCVDESSIYYPYLTSHQGLTGIAIDSSCAPLDFTNRPGDALHPDLITAPIVRKHLYYAFVEGFEPTSSTAVLVEAHGDVFVLVNTDTLRHLGIDPEVPS